MDAVKILGSLLSNNAMGSPRGGNILDNLLGGATGSGGGSAVDILASLLGGGKNSKSGGLGALGAILAAAAGAKGGKGGGSGLDMIGSILSGAAGSGKLGGLGELLGGGPASQKKQSSGGLGDLVGAFLGGDDKQGKGSSGVGDLLGSLLGGSGGGGLSSLLGATSPGAGGGDLLGLLVGQGEQSAPPQAANEEAAILIEAMCNAAKSDGKIDEKERNTILGKLTDLDESEVSYLRKQLSSPLDLEGFVSRIPEDMAEQAYVFSLMAIKLDTKKEAEYFGRLAEGLGIDGDAANEIHSRLGQPEIFA